jgi:hypothetical protein
VPALNRVGELARYSSDESMRYSSSVSATSLPPSAQAMRMKKYCGVSMTWRLVGWRSR